MKEKIRMAAAFALCGCLAMSGAMALSIEGTIEAGAVRSITAPYTGRVEDFTVQAGDEATEGELLFSLGTTTVYADFDGVVTGVFARPGDAAQAVQDRYGALMVMEQDEMYRAECSTNGGDGGEENKILHVGETVYVCSTATEDRYGVATITSISGRSFTLEFSSVTDLRMNDNIKVYRSNRYKSGECIGTGRMNRIDPTSVNAEGFVLSVHAAGGTRVHRGEMLLETVPDRPVGKDSQVRMPEDGVLLSVSAQSGQTAEKDSVLATYCAAGDMQLVCNVDEGDLAGLTLGGAVGVELDAYEGVKIDGVVTKIAAASNGDGADFRVTIALADQSMVKIGMNATIELNGSND